MNNVEREYGWEDEIKADSDFVLLPAGDYVFVVESFERGRHTPSEGGKLPACNKAIVTLRIIDDSGQEVRLKHNLFLHSSTEGLLSAFFGSIGLKKRGETLKMNWGAVPGKVGVCRIGIKTYNDNNFNEVKRMIYRDDVDFAKIANRNQIQLLSTPLQTPSSAPVEPVQEKMSLGTNALDINNLPF